MDDSEIPHRVIDRIYARIEKAPSGCWIFTGSLNGVGYGRVGWSNPDKTKSWRQTHRALYEVTYGPIPEGMHLDHVCHDPATCHPEQSKDCPHRACCNPEHLRAVTARENLLRGGTISALRRAVEECPKGHPLDASNTLISTKGQRQCKACTYERNRAYYHKNAERRKAYNKQWRDARKARRAAIQE